jgi:hypothetical protein
MRDRAYPSTTRPNPPRDPGLPYACALRAPARVTLARDRARRRPTAERDDER